MTPITPDVARAFATVTLVYRGRRGIVAESFTFNEVVRVTSSVACYAIGG